MFEFLFGLLYYLKIFVISTPLFLWVYKEFTMGICQCKTSMQGKTVLITGGSNGIGFETAVDLAKRGATLIIGCRKIQNVVDKMHRRVPDAKIEVIKLDLSSKTSIHHFAEEVISKYEAIDVLINNAGMINTMDGPMERQETEDGFELVMQTNYLGHALLNHLLLDLVKRAGKDGDDGYSRIILVSSIAIMGPEALDLCKIRSDKSYEVNFDVNKSLKDARLQYAKTKLAQVMYVNHLAKMLREENCNTIVASLHPGFVRTEILNGVPTAAQGIFKALGYIVGKNVWQGAQTSIHLAVGKFSNPMFEVNGKFFVDCKSKFWFQFLLPEIMKDPVACKTVWDETMDLLGIRFTNYNLRFKNI